MTDFHSGVHKKDWFGRILAIAIIALSTTGVALIAVVITLFAIAVAIITVVVFSSIDTFDRVSAETFGTVTCKQHQLPHTTAFPIMSHIPESYRFCVKLNDNQALVLTDNLTYAEVENGDRVFVQYVQGRFSNTTYYLKAYK